MADIKVIERLPMLLNLGDNSSVIGWADVYRDEDSGASRIEINLDERGSELLDHLQEISKLMAIGFAGIMRRSSESLPSPETPDPGKVQ